MNGFSLHIEPPSYVNDLCEEAKLSLYSCGIIY